MLANLAKNIHPAIIFNARGTFLINESTLPKHKPQRKQIRITRLFRSFSKESLLHGKDFQYGIIHYI